MAFNPERPSSDDRGGQDERSKKLRQLLKDQGSGGSPDTKSLPRKLIDIYKPQQKPLSPQEILRERLKQ